jgi:hypothetical protein
MGSASDVEAILVTGRADILDGNWGRGRGKVPRPRAGALGYTLSAFGPRAGTNLSCRAARDHIFPEPRPGKRVGC